MRILFIGSGEFGIPTLRMLHGAGHDVLGVITQPDRPAGRGRHSRPTPIRDIAETLGLPVTAVPRINAPDCVASIREKRVELAVVVAFGQKIGAELLEMFPVGIVNLHASLLPRWRGAAPIQHAIVHGDDETGVSVFRLVEKMDAGPILSQRRTTIKPDETASELHDRLAGVGCDAVAAAIERLQANPTDPGDVQDESMVTPAPKLSKADGVLDLNRSAAEVSRRINGLYSWPGARCRFVSHTGRSEEVTLARALETDEPAEATPPESVGHVTQRGGVLTGRGEIAVLEIQPAGSRVMSWDDFVNGRHVQPGDRFLSQSKDGS
ncbi:MAG: methionyl-tRNA formyltransferase [Phycisphaerae bacterium]